jgi:hypothetical protein
MNRSLVLVAVALLVLFLVLIPFGLGISIAGAIFLLLQLAAILAFLGLATWVVASVWKAVQHR